MDKKKLKENHPEIYNKLQTTLKHVDIRLHGYVFRKCRIKEYQCEHCKRFPQRSSKKLWSALPKKSSGDLFYDCEADPTFPGHYHTLLYLLKDKNVKIKPDGMFEISFGRCQVIRAAFSGVLFIT